ncbi:MAG: pyridoxal-dependent decarboxylase [Saprospiraceae bacterium]|nr:pyridoxal-dependent decarboxylase [Saprospiraceae bacterium]
MNLLKKVYDPETFRATGHQLIDMLADHLQACLQDSSGKVIAYKQPDENYTFWAHEKFDSPMDYFNQVKENSIHIHHPRYMGHQVTPPAPLAALAGMEGMLLNSGGAIYEMSAASSTLEKLVIDQLKSYFGFTDGDGIITSGGTLANLTALICARNIKAPEDVWNEGQHEKYAFMVSVEAHYCIDRAVRVMGWGDTGIIKVPVDEQFRMRTDLLKSLHQEATDRGIIILGIVGSAPTTSTGIYDNLTAIGQYCQQHGLWFHIDAAHGGPAAFSQKYNHLTKGCELADSITVDAHKMMMVPSLTTMLFFRNSKDSYRTFAQKAQYLWNASNEEWYNYGKRTMECTKIMLSTRIYALLNTYGIEVFGEYVDTCYDLGKTFAEMLKREPLMELAVAPDSNIVCFRLIHKNESQCNDINRAIRQKILDDGRFYIVQTLLNDNVYLRISIMNPFTSITDLELMLLDVKTTYLELTEKT